MFSVEIHFVSNGKKININYLSEFDLDSLRDCVYDFIPETSKLCMYSKDGVETFGEISNFTKEQYGYYKYLVKRIDPINPLWNDPVIVVLKKSSKIVELWKKVFKPKTHTHSSKRKYCCSKCDVNGHNKNNYRHK